MNTLDDHWGMTQNAAVSQDQTSCYTGYSMFPSLSSFYLEAHQQVEQWHHCYQQQQQQEQLQLSMLAQDFSQQNNALHFNSYQLPIKFTTSIGRKIRPKVPATVKRQRQLRRNERERERQARLNSAFDVLRGSIPSFLAPYKEEQKLTQIETLRLAKYYIRSLKGMLDDYEKEDNVVVDDQHIENAKPRTESLSGSDASSCSL